MSGRRVTNGGNETDLVIAFNEQVLLGRVRTGELKAGCTILLESMWRESADKQIAGTYVETHDQLVAAGYKVIETPMERECRTIVADARRGKNMFALGMLCNIYSFDLQLAREQIARTFGKKDASVIESNVKLLNAGYGWAEKNLEFTILSRPLAARSRKSIDGNTALALGSLPGMEICDVPDHAATSVSQYLRRVREGRRHRIRPKTRSRPAPSRSARPMPENAPSP